MIWHLINQTSWYALKQNKQNLLPPSLSLLPGFKYFSSPPPLSSIVFPFISNVASILFFLSFDFNFVFLKLFRFLSFLFFLQLFSDLLFLFSLHFPFSLFYFLSYPSSHSSSSSHNPPLYARLYPTSFTFSLFLLYFNFVFRSWS